MASIQQSSKALDRSLADWFQSIANGQIKLPRFQRHEAWDRNRISSFLNTVVHNLPVGVALVLEVGDDEKFISRYIKTAEENKSFRVTQHLLDGQQRLTAMWRALHNNYEYETYFIHIQELDKHSDDAEADEIDVFARTRYYKKDGRRFPLWCDIPSDCLDRGYIPTHLLRPADIQPEIDDWINQATLNRKPSADEENAFAKLEEYNQFKEILKSHITKLRERVAHFNLPYLSLPTATEKEVALQVFINMNTNSKPLSRYDIIVAEVESATGDSLHDLQQRLIEKCPEASRLYDVSFQILATSALLQDRLPNERGMIDMDKVKMVENWEVMENCIKNMASFLNRQGIYDRQRLPSNAVLGVIAACYRDIPEHGDFRGKAEILLQRYLWSAFFSDRYENSAASRAHMDYRGLTRLIQLAEFTEEDLNQIPCLNRAEYPIATAEELQIVDWPKRESIRARAILAVANHLGAYDFADNRHADYESLQHREYHHLYPDALLKEADINSFKALNCALITWKTNRNIGRKDPITYLEERTGWVEKETIEKRLHSHLIPYEELGTSDYSSLPSEERTKLIQEDFNKFLETRAQWISIAAQELSEGRSITAEGVCALASHTFKE